MPSFSSFALQFSGFTANSLLATAAEVLIVEAGVTSVGGQATLNAQDLTALQTAGRTVLASVNTSVTDHNRAYWQAAWVTPTGNEPDVGTIAPSAPDWLRGNLGEVDFDASHPGPEATLVDYRDPDWRALVVAQAVTVVQAGLHGVFLDDVARYFEAGYAGGSYDPTLADSMMALVIDVAAAVRAVNPDAVVVVNSGVYIGGDSAAGTSSPLYANYKAAIDGVLIENQYASEANPAPPNVLSDALANFAGVDILALENAANGLDRLAFLAFAASHGLLPYVSPDEGYGQFATAPQIDWDGVDFLAGSALAANALFGLGGDDTLQGGAAADTVFGGAQNDDLTGLGGADRLYGDEGSDTLSGGEGDDRLFGGAVSDWLHGEAGDDRLFAGGERDWLYGDAGADDLYGGGHDDQLLAGSGDDRLYGGAGFDGVFGGVGHDLVDAGSGGGLQLGGDGNDSLTGGLGDDSQRGEVGNDQLSGGAGLDTLNGDAGDDILRGGDGADLLNGDDGNDQLYGGMGRNRLDGGAGDDVLIGGAQGDILDGGTGDDVLTGGGGRDVFVFTHAAERDVITDFDNGDDRIDLQAFGLDAGDIQLAVRDWNGGVTLNLERIGGNGKVRILDHDGQAIALTLSDFLI